MRKKLVVGNWKMNLSQPEAVSLAESLDQVLSAISDVQIGICPTYLCLPKLVDLLKDSNIHVGAQDFFWLDKGAFTGQISARMLKDLGIDFCLVGHSETRGRFGKLDIEEAAVPLFAESNLTINLKIKALLGLGMKPILCVGETLAERHANRTDETIKTQIVEALDGIAADGFDEGVVAYEPVWAIGTGEVCDTPEASRVCGHVRKALAEVLNPAAAEKIRVLYGGSVKSGNAKALFDSPDIDGGLVGGASLIADEFEKIVQSAS